MTRKILCITMNNYQSGFAWLIIIVLRKKIVCIFIVCMPYHLSFFISRSAHEISYILSFFFCTLFILAIPFASSTITLTLILPRSRCCFSYVQNNAIAVEKSSKKNNTSYMFEFWWTTCKLCNNFQFKKIRKHVMRLCKQETFSNHFHMELMIRWWENLGLLQRTTTFRLIWWWRKRNHDEKYNDSVKCNPHSSSHIIAYKRFIWFSFPFFFSVFSSPSFS